MTRFFDKGEAFDIQEPEWGRPALDAHWHRQDVCFQMVDISQYRTQPLPGMPGPTKVPEVTAIRIIGVTKEGHSVIAHVHGFEPYFWMKAPAGFRMNHIEPFRRELNKRTQAALKVESPITRLELADRRSLLYYQKDDSQFIRVVVQMPGHVPRVRGILEGRGQGSDQGGVAFPQLWQGNATFDTFESNVLFELRFLVDMGIGGANWITLPAGRYRVKPNKLSDCQMEVDIAFDALRKHDSAGEYMKIAPARILSFDIECKGRAGKFPEAEHDPVIQIANVVQRHGDKEPFVQNVFCLGKTSPIPGVKLYCFESEADMLLAWTRFVNRVDPDVFTGYNIVNFDMPYLLNRAKALQAGRFPFWSRMKDHRTTMREQTFQNKAHGKRQYMEIEMPGRVQMDMLVVMQREHKLRSYSLNSVCHEFLGEQKEDVHHSIIGKLQDGNEETRNRLARYCFKDALLPLRINNKLMVFINLVEMARVTGVPCGWLIDKGQQIKVFSQILRKAQSKRILFPTVESQGVTDGVAYEGATVIEPTKGFHNAPVATLDFASLYPSIMMGHNLCYSTLLEKGRITEMGLTLNEDYERTPAGDCFMKRERFQGILPEILRELLAERKKAKKAMAQAEDPMEKAVYNGRQLALKISANSVYGFTGATVGKLPCLEISAGVTSYGRAMIEATKKAVEERYTVDNGYPEDAKVIYGDTDSVFIIFGKDIPLAQTMEMGMEAAGHVTKLFPDPVRLEFEKCYFPMILMSKKKYAGLLWTKPERHDKLDAKGIEAVRRDNCPLVAQVVSTILRKILLERSIDSAITYVKQVVSDLLMNRLDISQLIISKTLTMEKDEYAGRQAHAELAEKMRKRDEASAPSIGDRVPYVIVKGHSGARAFEKSEDPLYVLEHNVPIDCAHYLEHQLKQPLLRLFEPILGESAASKLFVGEHTRQMAKVAPTKGGIMKFAKVMLSCLGCRNGMADGEGPLCKQCVAARKEQEVYARILTKRNHFETLFGRVWTQCQRCQGSLHQDVICSNKDCSVFYMRKKVQKDVTEAQKQLERFGALEW
eukprot:TRINITY_DN65187_c0_g1_i1.p1 TRINITY_DN65187_c0_g1~~TRINITY_DN65187_c0_g1_i1.p1  ORF type:complete len:1051 (+),score=390.01 TRINITY_DN65187_c0_g1_i1:107-3259(+)